MVDDDRQIKYINVGMEFTNKVCKNIMENLEGEERERELANMKKIMKVLSRIMTFWIRLIRQS